MASSISVLVYHKHSTKEDNSISHEYEEVNNIHVIYTSADCESTRVHFTAQKLQKYIVGLFRSTLSKLACFRDDNVLDRE